jgi:hypothetical protein
VVRPESLCNPVDKNGEGVPLPDAHLTCYKIVQPLSASRNVVMEDQFARQDLSLLTSTPHKGVLLCAPSLKNPTITTTGVDPAECVCP